MSSHSVIAVDLFCGVGGLTHGLEKSGIRVVAGIDNDDTCKYAYEMNNNAEFISKSITELTGEELKAFYPQKSIKVLVGCAPCQTFSQHTAKYKNRQKDSKWRLLYSFLRVIKEVKPDVISMENVPQLTKYDIFSDFIKGLKSVGYEVSWKIVFCPKYGIPQNRRRLVLLASKLGPIELMPETHDKTKYRTVEAVLAKLEPIDAGEVSPSDPLHRSWKLTPINMKRLKQSKPGGTWRDWDKELLAPCHKKNSGASYKSVYGRMSWDRPSPTITTQFYSFGTGRFGHPSQARALSLREGAVLQTFPKSYKFIDPKQKFSFDKLGTHIGNAVPVKLGEVIGDSILVHIKKYEAKDVRR